MIGFPGLQDPFTAAMLGKVAPAGEPPLAPPPAPDPFQQAMRQSLPAPSLGVPPLEMPPALPPPAPRPQPVPEPQAAKPGKPPTNRQAYEQGIDRRASAIEEQAQTQAAVARAETLGALKAVDEYKARQQADMEAKAADDARFAAERAGLEQEVDDLSKQRVKPGQVLQNASTPALIGGAVVAFLSGFQAAKTGKNPALDMIQKIINDDIQSQMAAIETKRGAVGAKMTLLQQDIANGRDAHDARVKATALAYDTAVKQVAAEAAQIGTDVAIQKGQQLIGELEMLKAQTFEEWDAKRKQLAIAGGHLALAKKQHEESKRQFDAQYALQVDRAMREGNMAKVAALQAQQGKAIIAVSNDKNGIIVAPTEKVAEEINKKVSKATTTVGMVERLMEIREKIGGGGIGVLKPDERKEAESLARMVWYDLSILQEQGVVREGEIPTYNAMVGDPTAWRDTIPKLKAIRTRIVEDVNSDIANRTLNGKGVRWDASLRPPGMKVGEVDYQPPAPGAQLPPALQGTGGGAWDATTKRWVRDLPSAAPTAGPPASINPYAPMIGPSGT
jgi:hypothetical protein